MWRKIRIVILLFILATVAHRTWLQNHDLKWKDSLYVAVYPVNFDRNSKVARYISVLQQEQFEAITEYFSEEGQRYNLRLRKPFEVRLGPSIDSLPPPLPLQANAVGSIIWSLKFRWWAWQHSPKMQVPPDIRLYLLYHDPAQHEVLSHSTALSKGRIGLVNIFANAAYERKNAVVIAHELLHTVGATDKYDLSTNLPLFPVGFAEPDKQPLYPQEYAELMAGRLPTLESSALIPDNLSQTLIGNQTAQEIRWINH